MKTIFQKFIKSTIYLFSLVSLFLSSNVATRAISLQDFRKEVYRPDNLPSSATVNASAETKIIDILEFLIDLLLFASGSVAVLMLVYGGIRFITSTGNQDQKDQAIKIIRWAISGLLVVILAFALVSNVISLIYRATT